MGTQAPENYPPAKRPWTGKLRPFSGWFITLGFIVMALSHGAAENYLLGTGGGSVNLSAGAAHLFTCFVAMLVGVNLIALGMNLDDSQHPSHGALIISKAAAFGRQSLPAMATLAASSAAAGVVTNAANPAICFCFYALLIAAISIVTIALCGNE
ncbi:uncharacterized protein LOC133898255 [Phragmites australis]|uniref:uncharacterized protein LOC133898255 n=1 Tax=Phragmites australis TaxID=29695 RepID=UPI002D785F73|nr:uncharacterized protein LOC133898255 [Phragmites australis]